MMRANRRIATEDKNLDARHTLADGQQMGSDVSLAADATAGLTVGGTAWRIGRRTRDDVGVGVADAAGRSS